MKGAREINLMFNPDHWMQYYRSHNHNRNYHKIGIRIKLDSFLMRCKIKC